MCCLQIVNSLPPVWSEKSPHGTLGTFLGGKMVSLSVSAQVSPTSETKKKFETIYYQSTLFVKFLRLNVYRTLKMEKWRMKKFPEHCHLVFILTKIQGRYLVVFRTWMQPTNSVFGWQIATGNTRIRSFRLIQEVRHLNSQYMSNYLLL